MKVEFRIKNAPSYKVAYIVRMGGYAGSNMWRTEFNQLLKWAKKRRIKTGKWIVYFIDEWGTKPESKRRSVACLEIKGGAEPAGKIKVMKLPKQRVVSVTFDPDKVDSQVIYHGIEGWLQYRPFKESGPSREVYNASPWTNPRAWANCEVQVPIKRK